MKRNLFGLVLVFFLVLTGCDSALVDAPATESASADAPAAGSAGAEVLAKQTFMDICHFLKGAGTYQLLNIPTTAYEVHMAHGDGLPGGAVPGMEGTVYAVDCVSGLVAEYNMEEGDNSGFLYDVSGNGNDRILNGSTFDDEGLIVEGEPIGAGASLGPDWTILQALDGVIDIFDSEGGAWTDLQPSTSLIPELYNIEQGNRFFGKTTYRMEFNRVLTKKERELIDEYVRDILEARISGFGQDAYKVAVPNSAFRRHLQLSFGITDLAGLQSHTLPFILFIRSDWHDWRGMRYATSATTIMPWETPFAGHLSEISGLTSLETFDAHGNGNRVKGDLSDLSGLTSLSSLDLGGLSAITGDVADLAALPLEKLVLAFTGVTGDTGALAGKAFTDVELNGTGITGDLSDITSGNLTRLWLDTSNSGFTGDFQLLKGHELIFIYINGSGIRGDVTDVIETWDREISEISMSDMLLTGAVGPGIAHTNGKMVRIHLDGNAFSSTEIDAAVDAAYDLRATLCTLITPSDIQFEDQTPHAVPSGPSIVKIGELNAAGCVVTYDTTP